jgi:hypothetical protein
MVTHILENVNKNATFMPASAGIHGLRGVNGAKNWGALWMQSGADRMPTGGGSIVGGRSLAGIELRR